MFINSIWSYVVMLLPCWSGQALAFWVCLLYTEKTSKPWTGKSQLHDAVCTEAPPSTVSSLGLHAAEIQGPELINLKRKGTLFILQTLSSCVVYLVLFYLFCSLYLLVCFYTPLYVIIYLGNNNIKYVFS